MSCPVSRGRLAAVSLPRRSLLPLARWQPTPGAQAVRLTLLALTLGATLASPTAWAQASATPAQAVADANANANANVTIPAGPLSTALTAFASASGVELTAPAALLAGRQSPGLNGSTSVAAGFAQLLAGTGLEAVRAVNGSYQIRPIPAPDAVTLAPVEVNAALATDASTEGSGSYAARLVTIGKSTQSLRETPQSVTVVTRQQMDDQRLDTLPEVLENTPGVYFWKRPNGGNDIYVRGFTTDSLQYDGVPLKRYHSFGNDLTVSAVHLDRVEVMRGAQGLLEGAGSPAGSINLVRKRGQAERTLTVEGRIGSWNTYGGRLDAGGPLNESGTLRARAVIDAERGDSFLDEVWDRNVSGYLALDWDLTPDTRLGLGLLHLKLKGNSSLYAGVPRYTTGESLGLPRSATLAASWNEAQRQETQVFADIEHRLAPGWWFKASAVHVRESWQAVTSGNSGLVTPGTSTVGGSGFDYDNRATNGGLDVHLQGELQALGLEHEMVLGANYARQRRNDQYLQYWRYMTYDVFAPEHDTPPLSDYTPTDHWVQHYTIQQKGIYGLWRTHFGTQATAVLGARVSWYDYTGDGGSRVSGYASESEMRESGKVTPYAGLVYHLGPQWSAYASYAEIFDPQGETDVQHRVLPPMTGQAYEVGLKGELLDGALTTAFAVFRVDQRNRAVTDYDGLPVCGVGGGEYCAKPAGKVRSEGFEMEAHGALLPGLQVSGSYTYARNRYLQDANPELVGQPFEYYSPRHLLRLWSDYQLPGDLQRWRVGAGLSYRSEQRTSSTTQLNPVQGGYTLWNARVSYQIDPKWSVALNVDNLFNKRYDAFIANNYFFSHAGPPRRFLLSVRGTF